tara:strand:- start:1189 stop:1422 length:234 start_codon:yes stop_codon:yes gene_type:complete
MKISKESIHKIVKEISSLPDLDINQLLLDEGIIDSLSTIELISKLEEVYQITIEADDLNHYNFNSVDNIYTLLKEKE